jgi:hypothetical protein
VFLSHLEVCKVFLILIINKLIILISVYTSLILIHHLNYISIDISLFLTIRYKQIND